MPPKFFGTYKPLRGRFLPELRPHCPRACGRSFFRPGWRLVRLFGGQRQLAREVEPAQALGKLPEAFLKPPQRRERRAGYRFGGPLRGQLRAGITHRHRPSFPRPRLPGDPQPALRRGLVVDLNRAADELDPAMFEDLPDHLSIRPTDRVLAGFGVVPRMVANGLPIFQGRLPFAEAQARLEQVHAPYHRTL